MKRSNTLCNVQDTLRAAVISRHLRISPNQPTPLFASLTWYERALLATAGLWVLVATPYTLYSLWSLQQ